MILPKLESFKHAEIINGKLAGYDVTEYTTSGWFGRNKHTEVWAYKPLKNKRGFVWEQQ